MQRSLFVSALLLGPLVVPEVLCAQEVTSHIQQDPVIRVLGTEPQVATQQGLAGTEYYYQPGWYYPPGLPVSPSALPGGSLYSDGGFAPLDGLYGPPSSFWFYRPSTPFDFYRPSPSFYFYRPPPTFWYYRPYISGHH